jgi:hypothetical protein
VVGGACSGYGVSVAVSFIGNPEFLRAKVYGMEIARRYIPTMSVPDTLLAYDRQNCDSGPVNFTEGTNLEKEKEESFLQQ